MRRIVAAAGVLVLMSSVCYGQEVTPDLAEGSKALLFQVNLLNTQVATVNDGGTVGVGFKYFISSANAVRGVLELAKNSTTIPSNPGPGQVGADGSTDNSAVGIAILLEHHLGMGRLSPYFGGGVGFRTSSSESVTAANATPPATPVQTVTKNGGGVGNRFGVMGIAGAEFFLTRQVSIAAEYMLLFASTSLKDLEVTVGTNPTTTVQQGSTKTFGTGVSSAAMRLAFYF